MNTKRDKDLARSSTRESLVKILEDQVLDYREKDRKKGNKKSLPYECKGVQSIDGTRRPQRPQKRGP